MYSKLHFLLHCVVSYYFPTQSSNVSKRIVNCSRFSLEYRKLEARLYLVNLDEVNSMKKLELKETDYTIPYKVKYEVITNSILCFYLLFFY